jgi:small-conductance mechanosensitive channel
MRRLRPIVLSLPIFFAMALPGTAQMPMGAETEKEAEVKKAPAPQATVVVNADVPAWQRNWEKYMGEGSPYRSVILAVITLLVLVNLKAQLTKVAKRYLDQNAFKRENAQTFIKVWNQVWKFVIAVLVIIAMSGSLKLLGLTAGFFGMMLGWSLQQPVTGIAAWLMIILKKPFRIGDRVIIAGITGDVTAITLTHVILNQVGGSIGGEEKSGRGILIPNAILFQNTIINYTLDQEHMLDEVPVRLTFDSDWELAKKLTIEAASQATAEIIEKTGQEPFIRAEFLDWGILIRLRFNTIPVRRQEISTTVIELLLKSFRANYPKIRFAIPSSNVRYRRDDDGSDSEPPYDKPRTD